MKPLVVVIGIVAGCGSPTSRLRWAHVENVEPVASVAIYEDVQDDAHVGILFHGFNKRLVEALDACRVQTSVHRGLPSSNGPSATAQAHLTVVPYHGTHTKVVLVDQHGAPRDEDYTHSIDGAFKLEVHDLRAGKVTWRAIVDVKTDATPTLSDGNEFADLVLARLRDDHVLACQR